MAVTRAAAQLDASALAARRVVDLYRRMARFVTTHVYTYRRARPLLLDFSVVCVFVLDFTAAPPAALHPTFLRCTNLRARRRI